MNRQIFAVAASFAAVFWMGLAAHAFEIDCDIPAGNIIVESIAGDTAKVRQDLRDTKGSWFYWAFRVKGAAGKKIRFVFTDRHGGGPVGTRGPVVSKDAGRTFSYPLDGKSANDGFVYEFGPEENETFFYECHPYVLADWQAFVARHRSAIAAGRMALETLCVSRKGADVPRMRCGNLSGKQKYRMLVVCRHHCSESMASWVLEGIVDSFMADDNLGKWLSRNVELMCVPMMDYDGVQAGDQGKNRIPHDHNRDYSEFLYPETKALTEWVQGHAGGRLDAFLDLHCPWIRGQYNEYVFSPLKDPSITPSVASERRFSEILEKVQTGGLRYRANDDLPFGTAWNKGVNFAQGWSSLMWMMHKVKGMTICRTLEIPFANANGAVVTPDGCRALGRDIAVAFRRLMSE